MSLTTIFRELYASAAARGEAERHLKHGATVKVRADGRKRQVVLARRGASVGLDEDVTFRRDGRIPHDAVGLCWFATRAGWFYVSYTWTEAALTLPLEDLPASLRPMVTRQASGSDACVKERPSRECSKSD